MTGGPGSVWGYLDSDDWDLTQFELDEEGLTLRSDDYGWSLTLDSDQARLLYEAMHTYYSEEAD